jgi:hypothetical protein
MINANGVHNVTIIGGIGATVRMWRVDYANGTKGIVYAKSEWRHAFSAFLLQSFQLKGNRTYVFCIALLVRLCGFCMIVWVLSRMDMADLVGVDGVTIRGLRITEVRLQL